MHKLIDTVCEELNEIEKRVTKSGGMSASDVELLDKLANIKKNLLKGERLLSEMGSEDYSGAMRGGSYEGSYRGGYANRGGSYEGSYEGGSYARGRGRNAKRDSMGRYSSERGYSRDGGELADRLRELMDDAPDDSMRHEIERLAGKIESM